MLASSQGFAQVLAEPNPVGHLSSVTQFGMPSDAEFVFCDQEVCPLHSVKHLARPSPALKVPKAVPSPQFRRVDEPELSPAKVNTSAGATSSSVPMASESKQE